jgi:pilus assembly protein Flp/PilA
MKKLMHNESSCPVPSHLNCPLTPNRILTTMPNLISRFIRDETGATAIEYGLIAALIAIVIIGVVRNVGTSLSTTFNSVKTGLTTP